MWVSILTFFYFHVYKKQLPKRLLAENAPEYPEKPPSGSAEEMAEYEAAVVRRESFWEEHGKALDAIIAREKPKFMWHGGPFYGRLKPRKNDMDAEWYLYERAEDFMKAARGHLWGYYDWWGADRPKDYNPHKTRYSVDHLEVFIPL